MSTTRRFSKIIAAHDGLITSPTDLTGGRKPSPLFLLMGMKYRKLFDAIDDDMLHRQIMWRRRFHPVIKTLLPYFMSSKQIMENRETLRGGAVSDQSDRGIVLPNSPVIWMGNHGFRDDAAATLNAISRHAYMLFGSLPHFYNTFDGISAYLNGVVMINRKVRSSTGTTVDRAVQVLRQGADLMIYPEGVWNKSPNRLLLYLWPGIYRIAQESGAKIVPVVHYIRDPAHSFRGNDIHTVVDDPISIEGMSEKAALEYLRDIMAAWTWLLMEHYGKATRDEVVDGRSFCEAWEQQLTELVKTAVYYDKEIELSADYRPKEIVYGKQVWEAVAGIRNITADNAGFVAYAQTLVEELKREDFQRRF